MEAIGSNSGASISSVEIWHQEEIWSDSRISVRYREDQITESDGGWLNNTFNIINRLLVANLMVYAGGAGSIELYNSFINNNY